jgi:aminomuconate-semialdehyde/2-hydroxymuconate-6-semialdehyde dehydrogenase
MNMSDTAIVEGVAVDTRHWIGGQRVASVDSFTDISPIDEQPLAQVAAGGAPEVAQAVAAAQQAFPYWAAMARDERADILHRVADGIDKRAEELAVVETRDNGSLLRSHRRSVMPRVGMNFRFFADMLRSLSHRHRERITWDPAGVTAVITPWNAPLMLATWRIGPALAAGNTVVAKPPEWAPLTASLLAEITAEAGLPPGVFNVVQGLGLEAGAALSAHPGIRRMSFTGSVPTAGLIAAATAPNIVPVSFELGGKSPLLVFADADFDLAVRLAVEQFDNAGQVCLGAFRLLVQESVAGEFLAAVLEKAHAVVQGDPRDPASDISCLVSRPHFERVDGFVQRALASGATAALGGGPNRDLGGLFYQPTILTPVPPGSEIVTEEVFGPVLTVQTFRDDDQAVAMANDTRFGLAATMVTGDPDRAERISARLRAGTVWVNCFFVRDLGAPFGGSGQSGIGREGGTHSFDFYCDIKNTVFAPSGRTGQGEDEPWVR